jgi:hypothetical protein
VTDGNGVLEIKRYLEHVRGQARQLFDAGVEAPDAADELELGEFADWGAPERIVQNVEELYGEFGPGRTPATTIEVFERMAHWAKRHRTGR